jgi:very-short-patch-repair endonuclease
VLGLKIGAIIEAGNWIMPGIHRFDKTRQRARELRQQMTPAEVILWDRLRSRRLGGIKFRQSTKPSGLETKLQNFKSRDLFLFPAYTLI